MEKKLHCVGRVAAAVGLMAMAAGTVHAADRLIISGQQGLLSAFALQDIGKLTFDGDKVTVSVTSGDRTYSLGDIAQITFDFEVTSLDDAEATLDDIALTVSGGILCVGSPAGGPVSVAVYSLSGFPVGAAEGIGSVAIDLNTLASGVYVVRANNKTIKLTR